MIMESILKGWGRSQILIAAFVLIPIFWLLNFVYMIWWRPRCIEKELKKQGIHGRPYHLLFGSLKEMMKRSKEAKSKPMSLNHDIMPRLNPMLHELANTYRGVFVYWLGPIPRVMVTDPKLIREILLNKSGDFRKPPINAFLKMFATGLGTYDGEKWVKHRKLLTPAFHPEKLKRMLPIFAKCTDEMVSRWNNNVGKSREVGRCCELEMSAEFQDLAGDMLSRAAFGSSYEEGRVIFELQSEQCELIFTAKLLINAFPWLRLIPTKDNKRRRYIYNKVRALLKGIIKAREREISLGMVSEDDILGLLLKSNNEELQQSKSSRSAMSIEDIIEECNSFYFAGQETTAGLLTWTLIVLSMHTNWQEKAREEVMEIIGKDQPNCNTLNQLKMMDMIFNEVLRLYASGTLVRTTYKKTKLGEFDIPQGVQVVVPLQIIHRDPEQWGEDALEFNPERFAEGVSKAAKDLVYFPFSWGPRVCMGMNFALMEVKMVLAKILQNFRFELSPSYAHAPTMPALMLIPQYGAQIILHKL